MKKIISLLMALCMVTALCACGQSTASGPDAPASVPKTSQETAGTRILTDGNGREVEVPQRVERIVCVGVGALRYTSYLGAAELAVGCEDYETKQNMQRLYNYVNFDSFKDLPITGTNGEPSMEDILAADPQVIVMSRYAKVEADEMQAKTGIPVVVVPGSDTTLDQNAYETIRILGELYGKEERAAQLTRYLEGVQEDLAKRTADIPEEEKPSVYVAGVSFKGSHGFEGTEAHYGPFELIGAKNLADTTGQIGAFDMDVEQVLTWDPDVIFLDFNGMDLIREDYAKNPEFYKSLTAVQEGRVYSQISFRAWASNLETALADAYYAGTILFPEQFADIDPEEKAGEIFTQLLGENPYEDMKEAGYEFRAITLGE